MKYNNKNKPIECIMKNSTCYKGTGKATPVGVLWHSTGANNTSIARYVQPHETDANYNEMIALLGKNKYGNDWNHIARQAGVNAFIGKLADGTIATVQTLPWDYAPWGCGRGSKGSCNKINGKCWIQFEICESNLSDVNYFNKVYKEACELTAYLCTMYNLNPYGTVYANGVNIPVILCHADSCRLGFGSNHGDVLHWFKKHGKTMDDVRNDVAKLMGKSNSVSNNTQIQSKPITSSTSIKKGSVVKIASNAVYYNGKSVPSWVKNKTWIVDSVSGDKAIVNKSSDGKNSINSPINIKYLSLTQASSTSTNTSSNNSNTFKSYKVKVTADKLNIRKGAGTSYGVVGVIENKGVYTIVAESTGKGAAKWGLLKTYEKNRNGWISLDYCKKV